MLITITTHENNERFTIFRPSYNSGEYSQYTQQLVDALVSQQNEKSLELANVEGAANHAKISHLTILSTKRQLDEAYANGASPQAFQRIIGTLENGLTAANTAGGRSEKWEPDEAVRMSLQWLKNLLENRKE